MNKESFKLFFKKELKVILGKSKTNWWILFAMFLVTILSISFSKSSLSYLDKKMNDPFINWVNVQNRNDAPISKLIAELSSTGTAQVISKRFGFRNVEENLYRNLNFITSKSKITPFEGRTIKTTSPILNRILGEDNLIEGRNLLMNSKSVRLIVTKDMLIRMGYDDTPLFIDIAYPFVDENTDVVKDLNLQTSNGYFGAPLPVIAVVKQLPGMMSFLCTEYFVQQKDNQDDAFDLTKPEYINSLEFASVDEAFTKKKLNLLLQSLTPKTYQIDQSIEINSFKDYNLLKVNFNMGDSISTHEIGILAKEIEKHFNSSNIYRVFSYNTTNQQITISTDYLSIDFQRLDSIQSFAKWANEECGVKIDMTQIDAKNNFSIISRLGNLLSMVIVAISIAFIVIFLINLFRSHFEKVKKNIGTFKAFGMSNNWLIKVYMMVMSVMILSALFIAFAFSLIVQYTTAFIGILNEGEPIFNVYSNITILSMVATIIFALGAIYYTVSRLLKSTPGDLIYERD
ncbi:MAG: ABC transporter permease [Paludibacter sp.]|nr:ABC transporter permease [Paludibacter sp.]